MVGWPAIPAPVTRHPLHGRFADTRFVMISRTGKIHSIETCGTVDGPGIRFVVFTQGCPLRCIYCHNPDTWNRKDGETVDTESLMVEIRKYRNYIQASGGGLTVSGGDPLIQPDFVAELLQKARAEGFHTAIDTSGFATVETAAPVLDHTDLLLLDIKGLDPTLFRRITGRSDATLPVKMLEEAEGRKLTTWIRYVLLPGYTDSDDTLRKTAEFLSQFSCIERVQILPYHEMGAYKWEALGLSPLEGVHAPDKDAVARAEAIIKASGIAIS